MDCNAVQRTDSELIEELFLRDDIRDSAKKVWLVLWRLAGRTESVIEISYGVLQSKTGLSYSAVHRRLHDAQKAGLVRLGTASEGRSLEITVLDPSYLLTPAPNAPEPSFYGVSATYEKRNALRNEKRYASRSESDSNLVININKKEINKEINRGGEDQEAKAPKKRQRGGGSGEERLKAAKGTPEWERERNWVVAETWEFGGLRDLYDWITLALILEWITRAEVRRWRDRADEERRLYERSEGRRGKNVRWATLLPWIKTTYLRHGEEIGKADKSAPEPKPEARRAVPSPKSQTTTEDAPERTTDDERADLERTVASYQIDPNESLEATTRRVERAEGLRGWEAKGRALAIRAAWRRLEALPVE